MMNDRLEEQLRSSLDRQAGLRPATGPDLADVFGRARRIRRRRTATVAGVAAAAVLAVVLPTAVIVGDHGSSDRGIAPATTSPTPTISSSASPSSPPSATATQSTATDPSSAPGSVGIGGISIGSHTLWPYLDPQQRMHGGASIPAPLLKDGNAPLSGFAPYHGGWILLYDDSYTIAQADNTGHLVRQGKGGNIVTTSDGQETAFQIGTTVYAGIASGMGEGETTWQLKKDEGLYGYLTQGPVVSNGTHGYTILTPDGGRTGVSSAVFPETASSAADLVGGTIGTPATTYEGAVADGTTGTILWHNEWLPMAFSPDGTYVAARPVGDNGDPSAFAILDARTGAVVARTPTSIAGKVFLGGNIVWDTDDSILFEGFEAHDPRAAALLTLKLDGTFDEASEPMKPVTTDGPEISFVVMTR